MLIWLHFSDQELKSSRNRWIFLAVEWKIAKVNRLSDAQECDFAVSPPMYGPEEREQRVEIQLVAGGKKNEISFKWFSIGRAVISSCLLAPVMNIASCLCYSSSSYRGFISPTLNSKQIVTWTLGNNCQDPDFSPKPQIRVIPSDLLLYFLLLHFYSYLSLTVYALLSSYCS